MANVNNKVHISPGVYASETVDMKKAATSLGITKLAVVGETLKGPAFQPYWITSPQEYSNVFGGISTEKFRGSNYPKYELPFIANEYLSKSNQLCVIRTLGLSGYNAGPAWLLTGSKGEGNEKVVIAVLRSRGGYKYRPEFAKADINGCDCQSGYDSLTFDVGEVTNIADCSSPKNYNGKAVGITEYTSLDNSGTSCTSYNIKKGDSIGYSASIADLGRFTIKCIVGPSSIGDDATSEEYTGTTVSIPVSLNKNDNDYILNVLGSSNDDGDQPLFVESLFDVAWEELVASEGYDKINSDLSFVNVAVAADYCGLEAVNAILTKFENELSKKEVGKRYLYAKNYVDENQYTGVKAYILDKITKGLVYEAETDRVFKNAKTSELQDGHIYTVAKIVDENSKTHYVYTTFGDINETEANKYDYSEKVMIEDKLRTEDELQKGTNDEENGGADLSDAIINYRGSIVYNYADGLYYRLEKDTDEETGESSYSVVPVLCDLNDYKSGYRYSSTPWVVSNIKGDSSHIEVNKMFRFHTISDGKASLDEVKVSIENIRPESGEFDVVVRSYYDTDATPLVYERFQKCTMKRGSRKFIGYMIGTFDGMYENKSKYITVEVAETSVAKNSTPAGFLGYPVPQYGYATISSKSEDKLENVKIAPITYQKNYNEDINKKKQYFGISDLSGYDVDYFTYKGNLGAVESPAFMSKGFHLDCRISANSYAIDENNGAPVVTVDGESGYEFESVSVNARTTSLTNTPIIATEQEMAGSIYEDVKVRKFTMVFAGGFDGWDIYRDSRTNTDEFAYTNYKGYINKINGVGYAFDSFATFNNANEFAIEGAATTADYYATLAAISLLKNPQEVDINLLATPGIDLINNKKLISEITEIVEERADTLYIVTTPDKESGMSDFDNEIQSPEYIASDVMDTDIHSNYLATYYPWVKVDTGNEYIWLPVTKDVVRNIAKSDNTNTTTNLSPAGKNRGKIRGLMARRNLLDREADALYEAGINPVRTYSSDGILVMGQKTLAGTDDYFSRIDVRRCVLRMRKLMAIATLGLVFEPGDEANVKTMEKIIDSVMSSFITNRAIKRYSKYVSSSIEDDDQEVINCSIAIQPTRATEIINLNFIATNDGVYFDN